LSFPSPSCSSLWWAFPSHLSVTCSVCSYHLSALFSSLLVAGKVTPFLPIMFQLSVCFLSSPEGTLNNKIQLSLILFLSFSVSGHISSVCNVMHCTVLWNILFIIVLDVLLFLSILCDVFVGGVLIDILFWVYLSDILKLVIIDPECFKKWHF
jgi:hypothetical protein